MMSPELEEQEHSQKRSRASNSEESQKESGVDNRGAGGSKKARGRPRVDPRDTTAADVSRHLPNLSLSLGTIMQRAPMHQLFDYICSFPWLLADRSLATQDTDPSRTASIPPAKGDYNIFAEVRKFPTSSHH